MQSLATQPGNAAAPQSSIEITRWVFDRGQRPKARGWFHFWACLAFLIAGTVLTTMAWIYRPWWQALGVTVYAVGVVVLFGISAAYHRWPWRQERTVQWWRRADHATISFFIAATYTPLCLVVLSPTSAAIMLSVIWVSAIASIVMNFVWINHPRWLAVAIYLTLGWMIVPLAPQLWANAGPAVVWLIVAGGVIYSIGAILYATKWPGRNAKYVGYHEHFHAATIIAAIVHKIAVWLVVL